ncbi:succinate dehydrogenase, hydrophobic membrane anchor protein [Neisseria sp. Ec49-e6-T10]|uniref:succinate dehydrogenase, hydrophobic membrane anchor protein n=1 Tax=Neisseria sp. Ec49-e6-T10 TaxID=3140744 RepID=UPI003EBFBA3B
MVDRKLTGAHYGLGSWLLQRLSAVIMAIYTFAMILFLFCIPHDYFAWQTFFAQTWVRLFTQVTFLAVAIHVWVGIRDLWMDYIKCACLRLTLHTCTAIWLIACLIYSVKVIWGM